MGWDGGIPLVPDSSVISFLRGYIEQIRQKAFYSVFLFSLRKGSRGKRTKIRLL
jgi:hypothetical protein